MYMQIKNVNTPSFHSRSASIREADTICRMVKTHFPSISPSKVQSRAKILNDKKFVEYGEFLMNELREKVRKPFQYYATKATTFFFEPFAKNIKENRMANCGELARLASLICAVNGIHSQVVNVLNINKSGGIMGQCDHAVLAIPPKGERVKCAEFSKLKGTIIIDPWLGEADYAENMQVKYRNMYYKTLGTPENGYHAIDNITGALDVISDQSYEPLRKLFPELVINKK